MDTVVIVVRRRRRRRDSQVFANLLSSSFTTSRRWTLSGCVWVRFLLLFASTSSTYFLLIAIISHNNKAMARVFVARIHNGFLICSAPLHKCTSHRHIHNVHSVKPRESCRKLVYFEYLLFCVYCSYKQLPSASIRLRKTLLSLCELTLALALDYSPHPIYFETIQAVARDDYIKLYTTK